MIDELSEKCQRCGEFGEDRRTLYHSCFYDMGELDVPFLRKTEGSNPRPFFTLRVCKNCRSDWLTAIRQWFKSIAWKHDTLPCNSGIFVRRNGVDVEITQEEWDRENPGREAIKVKASLCGGDVP